MNCTCRTMIRITTCGGESLGRYECAECGRMLPPNSTARVVRWMHYARGVWTALEPGTYLPGAGLRVGPQITDPQPSLRVLPEPA